MKISKINMAVRVESLIAYLVLNQRSLISRAYTKKSSSRNVRPFIISNQRSSQRNRFESLLKFAAGIKMPRPRLMGMGIVLIVGSCSGMRGHRVPNNAACAAESVKVPANDVENHSVPLKSFCIIPLGVCSFC